MPAAAAPVNPLALHLSATLAKGRRSAPFRLSLTRSALQGQAAAFLVPTGIVGYIAPGWLSQGAVCAFSGWQGALALVWRFHDALDAWI